MTRPINIYFHTPFCESKCGFCDSYSFKLGSHQRERIENYVERLCFEVRLWSVQGNLKQRPVSTVHIGGGTPTFIGEKLLSKLALCCRDHFNISANTEWALESTVHALTPGMIAAMHDLGYRRLHIGVQSLEANARRLIGRRSSADEAIKKIETTLSLGWVVSVDMVCGLPQQTLAGFVHDVETLIAIGVDGISLYELLIYPQNRVWAEKHSLTRRDHLSNYAMFLAAASVLDTGDYKKNLFNHWANSRDANIYFTFPTRQEDCLAIGTIADGVFGDYHYRHPRYAPYLRAAQDGFPGLEGGLRRNALENYLQPITTAILSGHISPRLYSSLPIFDKGSLLDRWQECTLIEDDPSGGKSLTSSGSWFAGNMIAELVDMHSGDLHHE